VDLLQNAADKSSFDRSVHRLAQRHLAGHRSNPLKEEARQKSFDRLMSLPEEQVLLRRIFEF
jgi:hypothetical protein